MGSDDMPLATGEAPPCARRTRQRLLAGALALAVVWAPAVGRAAAPGPSDRTCVLSARLAGSSQPRGAGHRVVFAAGTALRVLQRQATGVRVSAAAGGPSAWVEPRALNEQCGALARELRAIEELPLEPLPLAPLPPPDAAAPLVPDGGGPTPAPDAALAPASRSAREPGDGSGWVVARDAFWVGGGVLAATSLALVATAGVRAAGVRRDIVAWNARGAGADIGDAGERDAQYQDLRARRAALGRLDVAAWATGGTAVALLAVGTILWVTAPQGGRAQVAVGAWPGGLEVTGRF